MTTSGRAVAWAAWTELLAEANARFRGRSGVDTDVLLDDNLGKLVGIPHLDDTSARILTTVRGGRIAIVTSGFPLQSTDRSMSICHSGRLSPWEDVLYRSVRAAASWLETSPRNRIVSVRSEPGALLATIALNVCLDIRQRRALQRVAQDATVPSDLLDDVLATLHGRDRRIAGLVCRQWAAAACDGLLPIDGSDAGAWVAPRIVELQRALPDAPPHRAYDVVTAWAWTRQWLGGGE
jgi:hypothetical protein